MSDCPTSRVLQRKPDNAGLYQPTSTNLKERPFKREAKEAERQRQAAEETRADWERVKDSADDESKRLYGVWNTSGRCAQREDDDEASSVFECESNGYPSDLRLAADADHDEDADGLVYSNVPGFLSKEDFFTEEKKRILIEQYETHCTPCTKHRSMR